MSRLKNSVLIVFLFLFVNQGQILLASPAGEKGKPVEAYREFIQAIHNEDKNAFTAFLFKGKYNGKMLDLNQENLDQIFSYLKAVKPESGQIQIVKEIIEGDKAILKTQLKTDDPNQREYGLIRLQKSGGQWKVVNDNWEKPASIENYLDDDPDDNLTHWNIFTFCNKITLEECDRERNEFMTSTNTNSYAPPCNSCIAKRDARPGLCQREESAMARELCLFSVAELTGDVDLCRGLTNFERSCAKIIKNREFIPSVNIYKLDSDQDGLTDAYEIQYHTDLLRKDTDGDGYEDGWEVKNFQNPVVSE
jgi:hypothetical protein